MKLKDNLKDKYYILMLCSLAVTILWTYSNLNNCYTIDDEILLVVYAMGFMAIPYIIKRYHLLDAQKKIIKFNGGKYCFYYYQQ